MKMKKKTLKIIMIVLIIIALIMAVGVYLLYLERINDNPQDGTTAPTTAPTGTTAPPTTVPPTTVPPTTVPPTTVPPTTVPPTTVPPTTVPPTTVPPATIAPTTAPTQPTTPPPKALPEDIISRTNEKLQALAGTSTVVETLEDPLQMVISVSTELEEEEAAEKLLQEILLVLGYEEAKADPNVAAGSPNPFSYAYRITHIETENGRHTFQLDYRFVSPVYTVKEQNYDTDKLTKDIRAYLNSLGKTGFDSQTQMDAVKAQPVIVLLERDYETVLSTVKAQVQSATANFDNYDFFYKGLTLTVKDGQRKEALLFYIYTK